MKGKGIAVLIGSLIVLAFLSIIPTQASFAVSVPNGIMYYVPITIPNSQAVAAPTPFQQMIQVPSSYYATYEAPNLQNVMFFAADGTVISSWLESGNANTAAKTTYWLLLPNGIPASSSITIFMGFASTSTNVLNSQTTGEAPQLSSSSGHSYGQYDDGVSVFASGYWNFAGTTLPAQWTASSGGPSASFSVNNGLTFTTPGIYGNWQNFNTANNYNSETLVADFFVQSNCLTSCASASNGGYMFGFGDVTATLVSTAYYAIWTGPYSYEEMTPSTALNSDWNVLTAYATPTTGCGSVNYTATSFCSSAGFTPSTSTNLGMSGDGVSGQTTHVDWARVRSQPPNGVMPSVSFGTVVSASSTSTSSTPTTTTYSSSSTSTTSTSTSSTVTSSSTSVSTSSSASSSTSSTTSTTTATTQTTTTSTSTTTTTSNTALNTNTLVLSGSISQSTLGGYQGVLVSYSSTYSSSLQAVVFLVVHNSAGQTVGIATGGITVPSGGTSTAFVVLPAGLGSGSYSAQIFAVTPDNIPISVTTSTTISVP